MIELVFIHGRSQESKDSLALKAEWIDAWRQGLAKNGLKMPIEERQIRFPYYGQTLYDLSEEVSPDQVAEIIIRGVTGSDPNEAVFIGDTLLELAKKMELEDDFNIESDVIKRDAQNKAWVRALVKALDQRMPFVSAAYIYMLLKDVYRYLFDSVVTLKIDTGVQAAIKPTTPAVVVSHSLGTVVAYDILRSLGPGYSVPLFVTLGAPLAISTVREKMGRPKHPDCATSWFNALDPRDIVALFPLDAAHFNVTPAIENKLDIDNDTPNRHGITGYLKDPIVAKRIHDALCS